MQVEFDSWGPQWRQMAYVSKSDVRVVTNNDRNTRGNSLNLLALGLSQPCLRVAGPGLFVVLNQFDHLVR